MSRRKWVFSLWLVAVFVMLGICGCPAPSPTLSVAVTANPTSGNPPLTVLATATPSGGTAPYFYLWTSAPGGAIAKPNEASTNVVFATAGTYTITCTITDSVGQVASASAQVNVATPIVGDPVAGLTLWNQRCVGCHPIKALVQPNLVVSDLGTLSPAMNGIILTDQQVADIKAYLAQ